MCVRARARTATTRAPLARALPPPAFLGPTRGSRAPPPSRRSHSPSAAQLTGRRQTPGLPARERSCGGASRSRRHSPCAPIPHRDRDRDRLGASPRPLPLRRASNEAAVTGGDCAAMGAPVSP